MDLKHFENMVLSAHQKMASGGGSSSGGVCPCCIVFASVCVSICLSVCM